MWRRRQPAAPGPQDRAALEGDILELLCRHNPVQASTLGHEDRDMDLPCTDAGARAEFCWKATEYLSRLEKMPLAENASAVERAERRTLESLLRVPLVMEQEDSPFTRNPVLYLEILFEGTYILLHRADASDTRAQWVEALLSRLSQAPRLLGEARQNLQPHTARIPSLWVETALRLESASQTFLQQIVQDVRRRVPERVQDVEREVSTTRKHLSEYADFLRRQILPKARGSYSLGADLFHFQLQNWHDLSYRDIDLLEWGTHELHESRKTLDKMAKRIPGNRTWRQILEDLKEDHPDAAGLIPAYQKDVDRARRFVEDRSLATIPGDEILEVTETPEFERSVAPFAAYLPPPPFGTQRRGSLWVTPPGIHLAEKDRHMVLRDHCHARIPITALHETYPGHHLQFSRLRELDSRVRRHFATSVFVEGWALYCEEMMIEQGFLNDPLSQLCQVRDHLWRACRIILDVRLQTQSFDVDEAARMLVEEACLQPPNARAEVVRYTQTPTQPLSYLVGKREIQALRREVERIRGDQFNLKQFHDEILSHGAIPVSLLREIVLAPQPSQAQLESSPQLA
ncbi:MAG: DUF885 domain-containing protein [Acidobacteriota bacterium]